MQTHACAHAHLKAAFSPGGSGSGRQFVEKELVTLADAETRVRIGHETSSAAASPFSCCVTNTKQ